VSYRETHYNFEVGDQRDYVRRYARTELSGRMDFSRIYGDLVSAKATRYKHEIIPEISYTNIPWLDQRNHPFFGQGEVNDAPYTSTDSISDLDTGSLFGLQFDYNDRVYDRNLVTMAVTNKLVEKKWVGDRPEYQQIAYLKLAQSYDATQSNKWVHTYTYQIGLVKKLQLMINITTLIYLKSKQCPKLLLVLLSVKFLS
jgi:LPS-assembly protein